MTVCLLIIIHAVFISSVLGILSHLVLEKELESFPTIICWTSEERRNKNVRRQDLSADRTETGVDYLSVRIETARCRFD